MSERLAYADGTGARPSWSGVLHEKMFFFQAEDGIRVPLVTGVQTCALPISGSANGLTQNSPAAASSTGASGTQNTRSEEHTSELQSRVDLVCRLLLEKK